MRVKTEMQGPFSLMWDTDFLSKDHMSGYQTDVSLIPPTEALVLTLGWKRSKTVSCEAEETEKGQVIEGLVGYTQFRFLF